MTRSVIYFHIEPGARASFLETFQRIGVLETSSFQAGYLGGQLLSAVADENLAMVIADWESPAAYQGWLDDPQREVGSTRLRPMLTEDPVGQVFETEHSVGPETSRPA